MSLVRKWRFDPRFRFAVLTLPGAIFVILFLLLPLLSIVVFSFWRTESYELIPEWNIGNYEAVLGDWIYVKFILTSSLMAAIVSLICLAYSWPCAYLIAKHGGRYRLVLVLLTAAPFLTGIILRVAALQQILGPIGLNFDFELLEVAKVCGARPWRAFVEVTWPLNWIGTVIGIVLVFVPTMAATVTPRFLGGPDGAMFANRLEHQFGATGTWALGSAMGVVLFVISLAVVAIAWRSVNLRRSGFTGAEG
jgi:ABC-type spermidine/putrescine transport system permease subunit I